MKLSTETKIQCGLVGVSAVLTAIIIHENRKLKTEMAKLLVANGGFVETAARIADVVELGNEKIEAGNEQIAIGNKKIDEMFQSMAGGKKK